MQLYDSPPESLGGTAIITVPIGTNSFRDGSCSVVVFKATEMVRKMAPEDRLVPIERVWSKLSQEDRAAVWAASLVLVLDKRTFSGTAVHYKNAKCGKWHVAVYADGEIRIGVPHELAAFKGENHE